MPKKICFDFIDGKCTRPKCKFLHTTQDKVNKIAKIRLKGLAVKQMKNVTEMHNYPKKIGRNTRIKGDPIDISEFNVILQKIREKSFSDPVDLDYNGFKKYNAANLFQRRF